MKLWTSLKNGIKSLGNSRTYLILGGTALVLALSSFGGGYLVGQRNESRRTTEEIVKTVYVPVKEIQEVQVRNVEYERKLQEQLQANRVEAQSLRNQLASRPVDRTCTLDPVNVGLLNEAIANGAPASAPSVPVDQSTTAALRDLELWAVDAAAQYNELATRHNSLVDWVDRELIQPQQEDQ